MSQGRDTNTQVCPNCGAGLDAVPPGTTFLCRYCGRSFSTPAEPAPPPRVIVLAPGMGPMRPAGSAPRRKTGGSIFSAIFSLIIVGAIALMSMRKGAPNVAKNVAKLSSQIASAADPSFTWDPTAGPPMLAAVGGGAEGIIGRVRMRADDKLWMAAFEGSKLAVVWKVGPFGTYPEGYESTLATVCGRDVIVTDYKANLHVYDVASGKETRTTKLSDRAKGMCASPDGKARVWIEMSDEKNILFDLDSGVATASPRPSWCPHSWAAYDDCRGWRKLGASRAGCKGPQAAPKVAGFEADNVIEDGDLSVALGKKHPGTATPMVVGFDPKTKAVRWQEALASGDQAGVSESSAMSVMDALAGGRFVAPYELTSKGWHFTAFDARSGQRAWDVPVQPVIGNDSLEGFSMSAARVYVMRWSSVEVYDAKTGALVGTIGD